MKVLLLGSYPYTGQESMRLFGELMEHSLRSAGYEVRLILPRPLLGMLHPSERGVGKWLGYIDRFLIFPFLLMREISWADVVHICDHTNAMYVKWLAGKPHVVTCHDLLAVRWGMGEFSDHTIKWTGRLMQRWIYRNLRKAQHIVSVSRYTHADVLKLVRTGPSKLSVVYNALNHPYRPMPRREAESRLAKLGLAHSIPFFLHVGNNSWRKNRLGALRIFRHLRATSPYENHHIVLGGKPWTDDLKQYARDSRLADVAHEVTNLSGEDLRALYSLAEALIFPSLQEGFGWPIIEAQACGCPVATSDRPPMTEIGADAAIYFDPEDEPGAAKTVANGLMNAQLLRRAGFSNARRFSTERMIRGYVSAYENVVLGDREGTKRFEAN